MKNFSKINLLINVKNNTSGNDLNIKNTGGSGLKAKPNPLKKFTASRKAYGGKAMKMYAMGGGMRKAKTYG